MKLILSDTDPEVLAAWRAQFLKRPEVAIQEGHLFEASADAFLLPGNSFGFLDSGLALEACERFGWDLQEAIRKVIRSERSGELLVGDAIAVRLPSLPRVVVYAPAWRTPRKIDGTLNAFLAARGAFLEAARRADLSIGSIAFPALGVREGGMDPRISARQIRYAYEIATGQRGPGDKNLSQQVRRERKLLSIPGADREAEREEGGEAE